MTLDIQKFTFSHYQVRGDKQNQTVTMSVFAPAQDYHLSGEEIDCDIDRQEAIKIIEFLKESFSI